MRVHPPVVPVLLSPELFTPFDGLPGLCALARDSQFRLLWCNDEYARVVGQPREKMLGGRPEDHMPAELAADRTNRMRSVLSGDRCISFFQVWQGARWHNRVCLLDPVSFGSDGVFAIIMRSVEPVAERVGQTVVITTSHDMGELSILSPRELEVLYWLASGLTVNEIAAELFRSPKTIGRHAENIHRKMGYTNRADLVHDATRRGLVAFSSEEWTELINPV